MKKRTFKSTRLACYTGYITQSITVNLAPLLFVIFQDEYRVSLSFLAFLTLLTFLIQIVLDAAAVLYIEHATYRQLASISQFISVAGLAAMAVLPHVMLPQAGLIISVLLYSAGSGLSEVVFSPLFEAIPKEPGKSGVSLPLLHSFYSWGQVLVISVSTLVLRAIGGGYWFVLPLMWAVIPLYNGISFLTVPMVPMRRSDEQHKTVNLLGSKSFIIAFLMMICAGAAEQIMAQWSSLFAEKGLGISKLTGDLLGPCLFALMMAVGRTGYGMVGKRLNMRRALLICSCVTAGCYLAAVLFTLPLISLFACALTGLGVCIMWPGMLAFCSDKYPGGGTAMFALLAAGGDIGCSLGPWLSGVVSDFAGKLSPIRAAAESIGISAEQLGLKCGILAGIIFPLIMIAGLLRMKDVHSKKED